MVFKQSSVINRKEESLEIVIPGKKHFLFMRIYMGFFFVLSTGVGLGVILDAINKNISDLAVIVFFFIMWYFFEMILLVYLLWQVKGREVFAIKKDSIFLLILSKRVTIFGKNLNIGQEEYPIMHCKNFRIMTNNNLKYGVWGSRSNRDIYGRKTTGGAIAFDYKGKTYNWGSSIKQSESKDVLNAILLFIKEVADV